MPTVPVPLRRLAASTLFVAALIAAAPARAATLPPLFSESLVTSGLSGATAMQFAPDGRLFVCLQGGALRVIKDGALLPTPFVTIPVNSVGERGLLGIAFDPEFAANQYVYVYYTTTRPAASQPHQPLHRQRRRRRGRQRGRARWTSTTCRRAINHNGGAIALRRRRQALRRGGRQRRRRQRPVAVDAPRQDAAAQPRWLDSGRQPDHVCRHQRHTGRRQSRHLGDGPAQPVHLRGQHRRPVPHDAHQRRRRRHVGGGERRHRRRQLRLADVRGHRRQPRRDD